MTNSKGNFQQRPPRILVRAPNWIGDQLLAYPFYALLREQFPKAPISVICASWVESIQFRDLVDEVISLGERPRGGIVSKMMTYENWAAMLRKKGPWDLGFLLSPSLSSAWVLRRAGVRVRVGHSTDSRGFLLSDTLEPSLTKHRSIQFVDLLRSFTKTSLPEDLAALLGTWEQHPITGEVEESAGRVPALNFEKSFAEVVPLELPTSLKKRSYGVIAPGSVAESRRWPPERYAELIAVLWDRLKIPVLLVGGAGERGVEAQIRKHLQLSFSLPEEALHSLLGAGSVGSYWRVLKEARYFVGNDSGLAHFASLAQTPTWVVWGAGDPKQTRPIGTRKATLLFNSTDCWPCAKNFCVLPPGQKLACLMSVSVEQVAEEVARGIVS